MNARYTDIYAYLCVSDSCTTILRPHKVNMKNNFGSAATNDEMETIGVCLSLREVGGIWEHQKAELEFYNFCFGLGASHCNVGSKMEVGYQEQASDTSRLRTSKTIYRFGPSIATSRSSRTVHLLPSGQVWYFDANVVGSHIILLVDPM